MKRTFRFSFFLWLLPFLPACGLQKPYPEAPGTIFIRQQICDLDDFKKSFFRPQNDLKGHGFLAYRFLRDPKDPKTYILAFQCSNLDKGVRFIQSSNFLTACIGSGMGLPLLWAGVEVEGRPYTNLAQMSGGMVVARYEVTDYEAWKKNWDAETKAGATGLYRLPGNPEAVIVTKEAPDITRAEPAAQNAATPGVTRQDLWLGSNLEEGAF
ncbi:MAG TPA: hypothetical protein VK859_14710 [bacterium]|nr:hypothetical protein [bacterium]